MEKQADINIRPNELEALKEAEVIRLTDGQEFVRKDVASKIMAKYAQQELQAYRDKVNKDLSDSAQALESLTEKLVVFINEKAELQQKFKSYKENLKFEVENLRQWTEFFNDDEDGEKQLYHVQGALAALKKVSELIDTVTPT